MADNSDDREQSSNRESASSSWRMNVLDRDVPGETSRNNGDSPDDPDNSDEEIPAGMQCAVCLRKYNTLGRRPKILTHCGHTFCRQCLETENSLGSFKCPTCRQRNDLFRLLPTNYAVMSLLEMNLAKGAKEQKEKKETEKSNESSDLPSRYVPLSERNRTEAEDAQADRSKRTEPYTQRQEYRRYGSYDLDLHSDTDRSLRGSTRGYQLAATGLSKQRKEDLDFSGRRWADRHSSEYRRYGRYGDLEPRQESYTGVRPRRYEWGSWRNLEHRRYGEYKDELSRDSDEDIAPYTAGRSNRFQFTATERAKLRREGKEGARSLKSWRAGILSSEDSSDDELLGACGGTTRLNRRKVFSSDDDLDLSEDYSFSKGKRRDEAEKERGLRKKSQYKGTKLDDWGKEYRRGEAEAGRTGRNRGNEDKELDEDLLLYAIQLSQKEAEQEDFRSLVSEVSKVTPPRGVRERQREKREEERAEERRKERQREEERRKRERKEERKKEGVEERGNNEGNESGEVWRGSEEEGGKRREKKEGDGRKGKEEGE
ncbi:zinc finger CCCH domain-containing protein 13-like [Penaeus monodon]|uniref:zinc finger CCCH domain-containing protein 13-like n=1 Tax=Penaeus monodon TaxID=6687 RepID=UPI0018A79C17|nr:zinc finger CCCH domain-containing protein 13-like [Penaeus monodon]